MAHECPECGLTCHCGGDIDDLRLPDKAAETACTHCVCKTCKREYSDCSCECDGCFSPLNSCCCFEEEFDL